jgi:putative transposase
MRKSRFTEEQIVAALQLARSGGDVSEICRKLGVTRTTFYRRRSRYGGPGPSKAKPLERLEDETYITQGTADLRACWDGSRSEAGSSGTPAARARASPANVRSRRRAFSIVANVPSSDSTTSRNRLALSR